MDILFTLCPINLDTSHILLYCWFWSHIKSKIIWFNLITWQQKPIDSLDDPEMYAVYLTMTSCRLFCIVVCYDAMCLKCVLCSVSCCFSYSNEIKYILFIMPQITVTLPQWVLQRATSSLLRPSFRVRKNFPYGERITFNQGKKVEKNLMKRDNGNSTNKYILGNLHKVCYRYFMAKKSQIKYSIFKKVLKFFCSLVKHKIVWLSVFWIRCRVRWNQRFFWRKWATQVLSLWTDPKCWMLSTWLWSGRSTLS